MTKVGEDLPLEVCRNSLIPVSTCSSCHEEGFFFPLASPGTYGPIVGKSREKVEPLSLTLKYLLFSYASPLIVF